MMDEVIRRLRPETVLWLAGGIDLAASFSDERRQRGSPYDQAFAKRLRAALHADTFKSRLRLYQAWALWKRRHRANQANSEITIQSSHQDFFPPKLDGPEDSLPPDSLVLTSLPPFRERVLRVQALAKEMGIRMIFLTQPLAYGAGPAWAGLAARRVEFQGKQYRISAATERRMQNRFNAALLELCAARRMECLDLAAAIPPDTAFFYDQGHFNDAGANRAAEKISQYLLSYPSPPTRRVKHSASETIGK